MIFFKKWKIKRLTKKIKILQQQRVLSQPKTEDILKEMQLYTQLANIYKSLDGTKKFPFAREMVYECYRTAATIEDAELQYLLAQRLVDEAKFREELQREEVFASLVNERRSKQLYEEALAHLKAAVALKHIKAERLLGLCHINGWGVPVDQDAGFDLIVTSIDQENSWGKVPQIFAQLGLNKPEFFSELMRHRKK